MNCEKTPLDGSAAVHSSEQPLILRTFEGFGVGDQDVAFEDMESAIRAFLDTPPSRVPRLRAGDKTVICLDPECSLEPIFLGDDGSIEAAYYGIMAGKPSTTALSGERQRR